MPATEQVQAPLVALVVGIDRYASPLVRPLSGCRNDVDAMSQLLQQRFGAPKAAIRSLLDSEASHEAIKDAFRVHLIATARRWQEATHKGPAPAFVFHFSGHGSQAIDSTRTKPNGVDETIVPYDSRTPGVLTSKTGSWGSCWRS